MDKDASTKERPRSLHMPIIQESLVNIECKVTVKELGTHHMFLAEVAAVQVDKAYEKERKIRTEFTGLLAYSWRIPKSREDSWKIRMEREKEK